MVTTMQALSGAGYPGVPALILLDNVIPYIGGEEEKVATEPLKLLGSLDNARGKVVPAEMVISAACNRVATRDGHLEAVSVKLARPATLEGLIAAWEGFLQSPPRWAVPRQFSQPSLSAARPIARRPA